MTKQLLKIKLTATLLLIFTFACATTREQADTRLEPIHEQPQFNFHYRGWAPYGAQDTYHEPVTDALRFFADENPELSLCMQRREARVGVLGAGLPYCLTEEWLDLMVRLAPVPNSEINGDPVVIGRINVSLQHDRLIDVELLEARYEPPLSDQYPPNASYEDGMAFTCVRRHERINNNSGGWSHNGSRRPLEDGCKIKVPYSVRVTTEN
ncbi:MAG: hypothetical protein AAGL99_00665 [Pseudomonadota bacterium]